MSDTCSMNTHSLAHLPSTSALDKHNLGHELKAYSFGNVSKSKGVKKKKVDCRPCCGSVIVRLSHFKYQDGAALMYRRLKAQKAIYCSISTQVHKATVVPLKSLLFNSDLEARQCTNGLLDNKRLQVLSAI